MTPEDITKKGNIRGKEYAMRGTIKITSETEARTIIKLAEDRIKNGKQLTNGEEEDYIFAKIFLAEIGKRNRNPDFRTSRHGEKKKKEDVEKYE